MPLAGVCAKTQLNSPHRNHEPDTIGFIYDPGTNCEWHWSGNSPTAVNDGVLSKKDDLARSCGCKGRHS
jgi:hypothetical protein